MIKRPRICIDLQCLAAGEGTVAPAWYPNVLFNMFACHPATDCDTNDTTHNPQPTCASLPWCPACQVETIEIYWDLYYLQGASKHSMLNWKQHLAKTCSCHKNWTSLLLCRICHYWWILCCVRLCKGWETLRMLLACFWRLSRTASERAQTQKWFRVSSCCYFHGMHRSSVWHALASDIQHTTDTSTDTGQVMLVQAPRDACCFTMFHLQVHLKHSSKEV